MDLDRSGNCFGVITERNALGLPGHDRAGRPGRRQPLPAPQRRKPGDSEMVYRIGGVEYHRSRSGTSGSTPSPAWRSVSAPVAYAAYAIGSYSSAQEFSLKWFGQDAIPAAVLKNTERTIPPEVAAAAKSQYMASMTPGGVFVTGSDWELQADQRGQRVSNRYIETDAVRRPGHRPVLRRPGRPDRRCDQGSSVTYANITQRNLQFLIMSLGPPSTRREKALSKLVPGNRFVKLNRRRAAARWTRRPEGETLKTEIDSRVRTPNEARALNNLPPLTEGQLEPSSTGCSVRLVPRLPTEVSP
jgi:hypothetical protein